MITPHISFSITINGQIARNPEDLDNFSKKELWDALVSITLSNHQLKSEMEGLSSLVNSKQAEIDTLRGELADLAEVKYKLLLVIQENTSLQGQVSQMNQELKDVKQELKQMKESLCAREIGYRTDEAVRKSIFSDSMKKPYYIRSFRNLLKFIDDPINAEKSSLCGDKASSEWFKLSESKRREIAERAQAIRDDHPDLKESIETLKDNWNVAHPNCLDYSKMVKYFEDVDDIETASSLIACRPFYELSMPQKVKASQSSLESEVDSNL